MKTLNKTIILISLFILSLFFQGFMSNIKGTFFLERGDAYYFDELKYEKAFDNYMSACENESSIGCFSVYSMYMDGEGVPKNINKAYEYLERSSELGYSFADASLGSILIYEKNDIERGMRLLKRAAKEENYLAYIDLAKLYNDGRYVTRDVSKAKEYIRLARAYGVEVNLNSKVTTSKKRVFKKSSRALISSIQKNLKELGYYSGKVDGYTGPRTRKSISDFQRYYKYPIDTNASQKVLEQTERALR